MEETLAAPSDRDRVLALFDDHAQAWRPLLVKRYGDKVADSIVREAKQQLEGIVPTIPDIGGDSNPMTPHLLRCTTSLALYLAMRRRGHSAEEAGWVIYQAVAARVATLPRQAFDGLTAEQMAAKRSEAARSQEQRYPGDWVWEFVGGGRRAYGVRVRLPRVRHPEVVPGPRGGRVPALLLLPGLRHPPSRGLGVLPD